MGKAHVLKSMSRKLQLLSAIATSRKATVVTYTSAVISCHSTNILCDVKQPALSIPEPQPEGFFVDAGIDLRLWVAKL